MALRTISYSLDIKTSNYTYNGIDDIIVSFNDNANLIKKVGGIKTERYTGNTAIVNFLKSQNAVISGRPDWQIGNISIGKNKDVFLKDTTRTVQYKFYVEDRGVQSEILIEQYINVSYYTVSVSQNITSSNNPMPLYAYDYMVKKDDFEVEITEHVNTGSTHDTNIITDYNITPYKSIFKATDLDLISSPFRDYAVITWGDNNQYSYTYFFNFYYVKNARTIVSIKAEDQDTNVYFVGKQNLFQEPTFNVRVEYADGTIEIKPLHNNEFVVYGYKKFPTTSLTPNVSKITEDSTIIVLIDTLNQDVNKKLFSLQYDIKLIPVKPVSVSFTPQINIIYGSSLSSYEQNRTATVTYNDGSSSTSSYKFEDNVRDIVILKKEDLPEKFNIIFFNSNVEVNRPTNFTNPSFNGFEVRNRTLISGVSKLNITEIVARYLVFFGTASIPATYYRQTLYVSENEFNMSSSDFDTEELNNEKVITKAEGSYGITFNATNRFDGTAISGEIEFDVVDTSNVKEWNIVVKKTQYSVGEKFLENDPTEIELKVGDRLVYGLLSDLVSSGSFATVPQKMYQFDKAVSGKNILVKSNLYDNDVIFDKDKEVNYTINVGVGEISTVNKIIDIRVVYLEDGIPNKKLSAEIIKPVWLLVDDYATEIVNSKRVLKRDFSTTYTAIGDDVIYKDYVRGYVQNIGYSNKNARIIMFENIKNPLRVANNMIVKFPCYVEGNADKINKSTFGIMFGADNYNNRLFVSGNSNFPNFDWHTADISGAFNEEYDNESVNNLTYFPDLSEQSYGSSDSKVVGYDIVSDNKLLVLKSKSDKDKTIYFRTPTYKEDDNGIISEVFTVSKGNNSVAGISPYSIANFNGDTLFIDSDNTVQGLDLQGIIGDTQRYANSRSRLIDHKLKNYDLSNSILWTNQKYLYLTVQGLGTFITHYETKSDSQYEWWLVDYDEPQAFIEIDNDTFYGNNKGEFFKIVKNSFVDVHKIFIGEAEGIYITNIVPDDSAEQIILNDNIIGKIQNGDTFKHYVDEENYENNIYKKVGSIGSESVDFDLYVDNGKIIVPESFIRDGVVVNKYKPRENEIYYLNMHCSTSGSVEINWEGHEQEFGYGFQFKYVEGSTNRVQMFRVGETTPLDVSKLVCADLCLRIEKDTTVSLVDNTNDAIKLEDNTNIVSYGKQDEKVPMIKGEISRKKNVVAYYITAPLLANIQYIKTLWNFTLTNDSGEPSELSLSIAKNKMPKNQYQTDISYTAKDFDYDEIDYNLMTFENIDIPRVFTRNKVIPKLKFVCFALKNENNTDCILSSMTITYTIPFPQV